jgi:RimJ/RimL family protein N-acetyltransferase
MKIVVIGGTGLIGSKTVAILRQGGHEVVAASPKNGINSITGDGLKHPLRWRGTPRSARQGTLVTARKTAMSVTFRSLRTEDKELFKSFIRSLPGKDNYYLMVDVHDDQAINRWMKRVESGEIIGVIALEGSQMIGYCNLHANNLPWVRHVGEMRMSVSAAYRGRGVGKALAGEIFSIARARGLKKLWARMAVSQEAAQNVLKRLGFRTEALLSDFVRNDNDLTESLVIMSRDFGERWAS